MDAALTLITGATGGLGRAFAVDYAAHGHPLVLVARRQQELEALAAQVRAEHGVEVETLVCDLSVADERARLVDALASREVGVLINNAGYGDLAPVAEASMDRLVGMLEVNCVALTHLTRAFLPSMLARESGTIVNVASTASFQPMAGFGTYAATKAYVLRFTQALAEEVRGTGVRVQALCPGPTQTGFFDVAGAPDVMTAVRREPSDVVASSRRGWERGRTVVVDGVLNRIGSVLATPLPGRWVSTLASKALR